MDKELQKTGKRLADRNRTFGTIVIGSGPAGMGLLFAAAKSGNLEAFLDSGVAFIESSSQPGGGTIGKYQVNSDTAGGVFLECLQHLPPGFVRGQELEELTGFIRERAHQAIPLAWVGRFYNLLCEGWMKKLAHHPASAFFLNSRANYILCGDDGSFSVMIRNVNTSETTLLSAGNVVMAMGGRQQQEEIIRAQVAGCIPLSQYRSKIMFTDDLLSPGGHLRAKAKLEGCSRPKAVIIGGSHSAFSSAWTLLNKLGSVPFSEHAITLMHRSKLKLFYNNREEALADGYTDFTDEDICPVTKRINRMGGIRWDSKSLLRKLIGLGEEKEPRMQLLKIEDDERTADRIRQLLDECSLLVPALGYRPATIPVYNAQLEPVSLHCHHGGPLVNNRSQVLGEQGLPLPGMFGAGLASGFMPGGKMGGEPSFNKQTNSLWAYQNDIGEMITAQLLERSFMPIGRAA